jgi:Putative transposase
LNQFQKWTRTRADTGAVTLIQRFGSAANLNIHLHCLVLDGVYLNRGGVPVFHEAAAPSSDQLEAVLLKIITRIMRLLTRLGFVIEKPDRTYLAETDTNGATGYRQRKAQAQSRRPSRAATEESVQRRHH